MEARNNLIIFIKNPVLGHAKTRIAKTLGDDAALAIYNELLSLVRENTLELACNKFLFYSSQILADDAWDQKVYQKRLQVSGDLGFKMMNAFEHVNLLQSDSSKVLIGSDCPALSSNLIDAAFKGLNDHDIVVGPTYDGGYYLIGMKQIHPQLFVDIMWSTELVFEQTMVKASLLGLSVLILPKLNDIDDEDDWIAYQNQK